MNTETATATTPQRKGINFELSPGGSVIDGNPTPKDELQAFLLNDIVRHNARQDFWDVCNATERNVANPAPMSFQGALNTLRSKFPGITLMNSHGFFPLVKLDRLYRKYLDYDFENLPEKPTDDDARWEEYGYILTNIIYCQKKGALRPAHLLRNFWVAVAIGMEISVSRFVKHVIRRPTPDFNSNPKETQWLEYRLLRSMFFDDGGVHLRSKADLDTMATHLESTLFLNTPRKRSN